MAKPPELAVLKEGENEPQARRSSHTVENTASVDQLAEQFTESFHIAGHPQGSPHPSTLELEPSSSSSTTSRIQNRRELPHKSVKRLLPEIAPRLVRRQHTVVVKDYKETGIIVDLVAYESATLPPIREFLSNQYGDQIQSPVSKRVQHQLSSTVSDPSLFTPVASTTESPPTQPPPTPPASSSLVDHQSSSSECHQYHRYVIPGVTLPWGGFPDAVRTLPLNLRLQGSENFLPPGSIFNVYCESICADGEPLLKVAIQSSPIIALPEGVIKTLSYSQPQIRSPLQQGGRPRFLVVVDFEATCDFAPNAVVGTHNSEIIEFPWVVLDTITADIVHQERHYIRPDYLDGITKYCTSLTGITQDLCRDAISLQEGVARFDRFVRENLFPFGKNNFRIVTDSIWDLQVQLRQEASRKNIPLEWWYQDYFDLREEFRHFYPWFGFLKRGPPLFIMLNAFDLDFIGRHHSGLDDCKTICQVVKILLQLHPNTFTQPRRIPENYDPWKDNSWVSFMGDCPPDAWLCPSDTCGVYNKPTFAVCRFCKSSRPSQ